MKRLLDSVPMLSTPRRFYAALFSAKSMFVVVLTVTLCVILNGKQRCFSVLAAQLQNETCNSVQDTCGMATLNWIAFLSETLVVGGNPFITNMLMRVHSGVLGGRVTYQFCMVLSLGVMLTGFVGDPESLFVTDTLIQGLASAVLLGLVSFKVSHTFPETSAHHRTALLLTEVCPWLGVLLCPFYGLLAASYGWQSAYFLISLLVLLVCLVAGLVDPKPCPLTGAPGDQDEEDLEKDDEDLEKDREDLEKDEEDLEKDLEKDLENDREVSRSPSSPPHTPSRSQDMWEDSQDSEDGDGHCQHPSLLQLLLNANLSKMASRSVVLVWFLERALALVAEYNCVVNLVHYMVSFLQEPLARASLVMVTLGFGSLMGSLTIFTLGPGIRPHLTKIYLLASILLVVTFVVWQIYGSVPDPGVFSVPDAHFMVLVVGVFGAMTSAQSAYVAEDILERPKVVAVSLTKLAQALGLLLGPISSGVLIQINAFHSFFMIQAFIHSLRIMLLAYITFRRSQASPKGPLGSVSRPGSFPQMSAEDRS